jgi:hypothetical protein
LPLRSLVTRRADVFGIQSVYFRTSVKDVLTRFALAPYRYKLSLYYWRSNMLVLVAQAVAGGTWFGC